MRIYNLCVIVLLGILSFSCINKEKNIKPPNILFAISDDQSFLHTSFSGCRFISTPAFDKVAREGVYFPNCYSGSPGCAPSRSALVTGRHHWQNEQSGQHGSSWLKKYVPFTDLIENNGYSIGRSGKGVGPFRYARSEKDSLWRNSDAGGPVLSNIKLETDSIENYAKGINKTNYSENFKYFIENLKGDKPFFFWYGGHEPHRNYEKGSWKRMGKKLEDVEVPKFLPDNNEIRGDLLDYAVEVEWFDYHLQKMLEYLEEIGELENTIVIVTADNGMPFPRAKANCYDYGAHVPLAISYPKEFKGSRIFTDPVGFIDIAPTILEITNTPNAGMMPITGKSILQSLKSEKSKFDSKSKRAVFSGRERHSSSRYLNWGYPQRAIRQGDYLLVWNMKPERFPAGAFQRYDDKDSSIVYDVEKLDTYGKYTFNGVLADIDESPSKTYLIENKNSNETASFFELACNIRPEFEMYNVVNDNDCIKNLIGVTEYESIEEDLKKNLKEELKSTNDPRIVGPVLDIFDTYKRYMNIRKFPKPDYLN